MTRFESIDRKMKKGWLLGLIKMMKADGRIDPKELLLVESRRKQWGLTTQDIIDIQQNPDAYPYIRPSMDKERIVAMLDFMLLMMIDGDIDVNELRCCHSAAMALGIPENFVDAVVSKARHAILSKTSRANQEQELLDFLQSK